MSNQGYPRRKQAAHGRGTRDFEPAGPPPDATATRAALDVASYVSDMTAQLEAMAQSASLELLSYFLGMARSEADLFIRTNAGPGGSASDDDEDGESDQGQAEFDSGN